MNCPKCGKQLGFFDIGDAKCARCGTRTDPSAAGDYVVNLVAAPIRIPLEGAKKATDAFGESLTRGPDRGAGPSSGGPSGAGSIIDLAIGGIIGLAIAAVIILGFLALLLRGCDSTSGAAEGRSARPREGDRPSLPAKSRTAVLPTLCGHSEAKFPDAQQPVDWGTYKCRNREAAGELWDECLSRATYSAEPGTGCPGRQRCCPN